MRTLYITLSLFVTFSTFSQTADRPLRIGIAGLTHSHVHWIFQSAQENKNTFEIVGIAEPDRKLAERFIKQYQLPPELLYASLDEMLNKAKPEAVTAFNSIQQHLEVVQACAPKKIHVMVEKPLAVSLDHARQMETLAKKYNIHILTNYETTWYGSNHEAYAMIHQQNAIGEIKKMVVHDGHRGPKEIGVNPEFLEWLTHPEKNGAGALMDFGCYGANLITWLMKGEKPQSVVAVTQQFKPEIYANVDDEATIIVTYPKAQGIIQASWNWPYNRKDMEIYGQHAYLKADKNTLLFREGDDPEQVRTYSPLAYNDPFNFLAAVIRGKVTVSDTDLSALPLNITAMEILDAARQSAREGKTVFLKKKK
jgi:predicted dehydrogenase